MIPILCVGLLGFSVGIITGHLMASRTFDKALHELDLRHHQENLDRNYNFLKLGRTSDRLEHRHWNN